MNNKAKEIFKGVSMKTLLKILANNLFRKLKSILYDINPHKDPKQLHLQSNLFP
jgi:hypothetical protein